VVKVTGAVQLLLISHMSALFAGPADGYDRFMGRYSVPLAPRFADFAEVGPGQPVLDVGCGTAALTKELVRRAGAPAVSAVDPVEHFAAAAEDRCPGVDVRVGAAEQLPFGDDEFDVALAQLVVHFMTDPSAGICEMARVTRPGGVVAACVWDHAGHSGPLERFWAGARVLDPHVDDESRRAGTREGQLVELFQAAGLSDVEQARLSVTVKHADFDAWWEPLTLGFGPAGAYLGSLAPDRRAELRERCRELGPTGAFAVTAYAWAARGSVAGQDAARR
jgi:ubiquinone/menaquinone biosynthesis C-methylase UbiE